MIKQSAPQTCCCHLDSKEVTFTVGKQGLIFRWAGKVRHGNWLGPWRLREGKPFGCPGGAEAVGTGLRLAGCSPPTTAQLLLSTPPREHQLHSASSAAVPFSLPFQGCSWPQPHSPMSEGVTYADLQFARSPPEKSQWEEPNEGELTYENVQGPWGQEAAAAAAAGGPLRSVQDLPLWPISCHLWSPVTNRQMLAALTVFLFLLAANIGLGIQYLQASQQLQQASRQLQQASRDHVAERHVLGEELHALRVSLEESQHLLRRAQEELNSTTVALWESRAAENRTRRQLQRQGLLLTQANHSLALLQTERENAEASLSQATSCQQIGCCAPGWTLFRWRCLQASTQKTTWEDSSDACKRMTSQLLVLKPWSARELWEAVGDAYSENRWDMFWVGLRCERQNCKWVDDSPYRGSEISWTSYYDNYAFVLMPNGHLQRGRSLTKAKYICEKAASPEPPPN